MFLEGLVFCLWLFNIQHQWFYCTDVDILLIITLVFMPGSCKKCILCQVPNNLLSSCWMRHCFCPTVKNYIQILWTLKNIHLLFCLPLWHTHTIWQGLTVLQNPYVLHKVRRDVPLISSDHLRPIKDLCKWIDFFWFIQHLALRMTTRL